MLGDTKLVEKLGELPTKHEPMLKPLKEERPKTSLTLVPLIEKVEQYLDGLRKHVHVTYIMVMCISLAIYVYISHKIVCAYCMW